VLTLAARIQRHVAALTGVPDHGLRLDYRGEAEGWTAAVPVRPRQEGIRWVTAAGATPQQALAALAAALGMPHACDHDPPPKKRRATLLTR
jgi:hypothetical protein